MEDLDSKIVALMRGSFWLDDWDGRPRAIYRDVEGFKFMKFMKTENPSLAPTRNDFIKMDRLIERADAAEALTSKYLYIREAKKWFLNNKFKA
jgi:hypothetical protein